MAFLRALVRRPSCNTASGHSAEASGVAHALGVSQVQPIESSVSALVGGSTVVVVAGLNSATSAGSAEQTRGPRKHGGSASEEPGQAAPRNLRRGPERPLRPPTKRLLDRRAIADFLDIPARSVKPREHGITHVIDRGLSVAEVDGLLEVAGEYVDIVKLGWGTALVSAI